MSHHNFLTLFETEGLVTDDIDVFAYEAGDHCNGPKCRDCGAAKCHHCHPEFYQEDCPGSGLRNIVVRQQDKEGAWVPRDAWYVMDVDTGECFAWSYRHSVAASYVPIYEKW